MKKMIIAAAMITAITASCKKEAVSTETTPIIEPVDTAAKVSFRGTFTSGPFGTTTGVVKIYNSNSNMLTLVLDSFMVNAGPDLHVYLSKEVQPINFIDLGKLKSTGGTQVYNIAGNPDFSQYKYALIHCQQYDHLFGNANLK